MRIVRVPKRLVRPYVARAGLAALPVVSLGLLCPVPSLVLALRRGSRADRWVFGGFGAVLAASPPGPPPRPGRACRTPPARHTRA